MFKKLATAAKAIHDWARPYCKKCQKHAFPHDHCDLCAKITSSNQAVSLKENYKEFNKSDTHIFSASFICDECSSSKRLIRCVKTQNIFLEKDDKSSLFQRSQMHQNMHPYHPSSRLTGALSEEGLAIISREHSDLQERLRNWSEGTRRDFIRNYRIIKELGLIREDGEHDDPAEVENSLKWHTVQIGGNGFIKFFYDKQIKYHEEQYIAGYSKNGNPYYRTRHWTTAYFTGHAIAVIAESENLRNRGGGGNGGGGNDDRNNPRRPPPSGPKEKADSYHASVLGLTGKCTKEEIKQAYRSAMKDYHPDKVAHLGVELRELAGKKAKEINEAYEHFCRKYNIQ